MAPSPLTVAVEQGRATFQCQHSLCDAVIWQVNGTSLNMTNLPNISCDELINSNIIIYTLSIKTLLKYNQTIVVCVAVFFDGTPPQFTAPVTLLIQGL